MCVVNKQFELFEFVFYSVYVDLQYDKDLSHFYCWVCVLVLCCEVAVVPYAMVAVQSCCTLWISASYRIFVHGRYRKSRLVCV